jgi:pimeloyl-ACP methyl ester carboxylesterase
MSALSAAHNDLQVGNEGRDQITVHDRRVVVDGIETQYLEAGEGSPLLLLHGHEQSATSWRWVIPALARTHRVLAVSLPGTGESESATGDHAPGNDMTPFIAAFLDTLSVDPPLDVVGHSAGGAIALRLALADPDRIHTLTLVDSAGLGRAVHPLLALDTLPGVGELAIMISRIPGGAVARTGMSTAMLFAQPWRIPAEFLAEHHALGRRPGQLETSTTVARALFGPDGQRQILLEHLPTLTTPTLVIWGGCDYVLPAHQAQTAVDLLPHGRLALLPDCGHLPHVEQPERFAAVLGAWLSEQGDQQPTPEAVEPDESSAGDITRSSERRTA